MVHYREIYAYPKEGYRKDCKELRDINWNELTLLVRIIQKAYKNLVPPNYKEIIEEEPPIITEETFNPRGWVGTYPVGDYRLQVIPKPDLLTKEQFKQIMKELAGWLELIGSFFESFMSLVCPFEPIFRLLLCMPYSRRLTEYTELAISHFIPRSITFSEYVGPELRGKPLWSKMPFIKAKDTKLLASSRIKFSFRTLPNLLLVRFHLDLLRDMKDLLGKLEGLIEEGIPSFLQYWKAYVRYHEGFISSRLWSDLLKESLEINFNSLEVLEKTRRLARGLWQEIIDLWEAYQSQRAFFFDLKERFDNSLKPLSKIYELWCFKKLCDLFKINREEITKFPCSISARYLEKNIILHYNKRLGKFSEIMKKIPGASPGRPDFAIENKGKIVCIMDAKCKSEIKTDDAQRFLSYLFDYMYPHSQKITGLIFYIPTETTKRKLIDKPISVKETKIYLIPLTPDTYNDLKDDIISIIQSSLRD